MKMGVVNQQISYLLETHLPGMILYLLGPPGVGKGTQVKRLIERLDQLSFRVISPGEEFRRLVAQGGPVAEEIERFTSQGKIVPFSLLEREVLTPFAASLQPEAVGILDGFPRTAEQVDACRRFGDRPQLAIFFEARDQLCAQRVQHGSRGRSDDDMKVVRERLALYRQNLPSVKAALSAQRIFHLTVDSSGSPDETTEIFLSETAWGLQVVKNLTVIKHRGARGLVSI